MKHLIKNRIERKENGSVYIEFIFVLPILFVIACWSTELINQIRFFNSAISLSKTAAEYVSRDCSTEVAIRTTDCVEYIPRELDTLAQTISEGSHVAIHVRFRDRNSEQKDFYMLENQLNGQGDNFEYPVGVNGIRCVDIHNVQIDLDNYNNLNSLVVAESYVRYRPLVPYIPLFWMSQDSNNDNFQVGDGQGNVFICDQTIL